MARDYTAQPREHVRRSDRAIDDDAWIIEFLKRTAIGVLATVHEGQPYLNSNLFVYDAEQHAIYMHTAHTGRTPANIGTSGEPPICFTATEMGRLLPADEALEFSVEYSSVVVFGTARLLSNDGSNQVELNEARYGLQQLLDKYAPHLRPDRDYRPIADDELKRTAVYRITIETWTGKHKQAPDDFPGAFWYGD